MRAFGITQAQARIFFELAYRQIWLFNMRHYPEVAKYATSKKVVAKTIR